MGYLNRLLHCPRAATVAIAENDPRRAREISDRFKLGRSYSDYRELVDQPDIDAVAIALPSHWQAQAAIDALKARKHVLLERPMALHSKDAAKIIEASRASKRLVMVAQDLRFCRHAQMARTLIQRGELGELYHARAYWRRHNQVPRIGSWRTQKKLAGGGCLLDLGQEILDVCLHLLGEFEAVTVLACATARFGPRGLGEPEALRPPDASPKIFDVEDAAVALIRLKSGRTVNLEVCWAGHWPPDPMEKGLEILGANGGLSLFPARLYRPGPNGYECTLLQLPKVAAAEDPVTHFVQCVLENRKPLVSPEESLALQKLLDALLASAASGKETAVK